MAAPQHSALARKRLSALLGNESLEGSRLLIRLREFRAAEEIPAFTAALRLLANLEMADDEAEQLLVELLAHRDQLGAALGRDPGLHVAAIDFLSNVKNLLSSPTVIESSQLEQTERSAMTDPLTTLFNRRYFDGALEIEVRRSRRYSVPLALLMLDLDFFKSVNDIYGHVLGDQVLRRAGHVVRRAVRESDLACRFGGDEFAVILPQTDRLGAYAVADRIRRRVESDFGSSPIEDRVIAITVSGGLSACPEDAATPESLIECADRALYRSKSQGKNGIVIHHAERRRAVRFPVKPSTRAELSAGDARAFAPVHALNLSRGGALLRAEADDLPAGPVELTLWEENDRWSIAARVVRVEDRTTEGWRTFAVAFDRPLPDPCLRRSVLYTAGAWSRVEGAA